MNNQFSLSKLSTCQKTTWLILMLSFFLVFNALAGETPHSEPTNGPYVSYDEAGKVSEEGQFKNGKRDGLWKLYVDGVLWCEKSMKVGVEHGMTKTYFPNGNLMKEVPYVSGHVQGTYRQYDENGKLIAEKVFK